MGYDLHITRATQWYDSELNPILLKEWNEYISLDPEFEFDIATACTPEGEVIEHPNDGLAVWTAYSGHGRDGNKAWFDYCDGRIVVKNPSEEIIHKMRSIAQQFGARVIGDEGESY